MFAEIGCRMMCGRQYTCERIEQGLWKTWSRLRKIMRQINVSVLQQHVGELDGPFILVMLLSEHHGRRMMTTRVRPSAVCLRLNDRNVERVWKGRLNDFFHFVLCVPLQSLVIPLNNCNLSLPGLEDFKVFYQCWILIYTCHTSPGLSLWHLPPLCVNIQPFLRDCLFCLWLLVWVVMCAVCVYFTAWHRRGSADLETLWKCHCLVVLCYMAQFIQRQWFRSPTWPRAFVCPESGTVNKW